MLNEPSPCASLECPPEPLPQNGASADPIQFLTKLLYSLRSMVTLCELEDVNLDDCPNVSIGEQVGSTRVPVIPYPVAHLQPYMWIMLNVANVPRLHTMLRH